ncbi:MAG: sugar phosphate nucleotidyltransferase [Clostridia bacterium]
MKAIIMAGGEGSRLRPLTCTIPKPMVPLLNKPCIDYCVDLLKLHNIRDIATTLFYLPNILRNHMGTGARYDCNVKHFESNLPLGTAGSIKEAILGRDTHIIVSGDSLTDCDFTDAIAFHRRMNAKITIILKRVDIPMEYGIALVDKEKRITRFLEKPSKSEVISDLANTGMYIIEPEILDMIPDRAFDFSNDLFPMLLDAKIPIYGYEMKGYWCDIGNIEQYISAQQDMLNGKVAFFTSAEKVGNIFIERGANISEGSMLRAPCYISNGSEIGEKVVIEALSVIGSNAKIQNGCSIKKSIILKNAVIRDGADIRGAIICENAELNEKCSVFEESVIGAFSVIGKGASIIDGASVWPEKRVENEEVIKENRVFGNCVRLNMDGAHVKGYCDTEISPERALRLAAAFATTLPENSDIGISTDGNPQSNMLKHAAESGIISQGADVYSLPHMPSVVLQFAIRQVGLSGGIYISTSRDDPHIAYIGFFDKSGMPIDQKQMKKIKAKFNLGEQRPKTNVEVGIISEVTGTIRAYETYASLLTDCAAVKKARLKVAIDAEDSLFEILAIILMRMGVSIIRIDSSRGVRLLNETLSHDSDIGLFLKSEHELEVVCSDGIRLSRYKLLTLLVRFSRYMGRGSHFAIPLSYPDIYARYLMDCGTFVLPAPDTFSKWERFAFENNAYVPELFDSCISAVRLIEIEALGLMPKLSSEIPDCFTSEEKLKCTFKDVGKALRSLVETEREGSITPMDGLKIDTQKGWVFVKSGNRNLKVVCSSFKEEYAEELSKMYINKLKASLDNEK